MNPAINNNLYQVLRAHFPGDPGAPCLLLPDGKVVSYALLEQGSARYAGLLAALGVEPGDRVAVQVKKTPQALFLYLGCLRAGAVYLPLNDAYQRHEIEYFLADATPRVCVCRPQLRALAVELAARCGVSRVLELDDHGGGSLAAAAAPQPPALATRPRGADGLAAILHPSGPPGR
ncbi:MAG: AMP-binding protein, partial [Syntrophales bacterium LBB04]|nr:AMP-binding protein [Syntrophales bacterium LBB04]